MKYVQIQSSMNITVTAGLQGKNFTKTDSDIPNRLKVTPTWPKMTCLIRAGKALYPAEIAEWPSVQSCVRSGIMTIGEYTDKGDGKVEEVAKQLAVNSADPGHELVDDEPTEDVAKPKRKKKAAKEEPKEEPKEDAEEIVEKDDSEEEPLKAEPEAEESLEEIVEKDE